MSTRGRIRDLTIGLFLDPKGVKDGARKAEQALDDMADGSERSFRRLSKAAEKAEKDTKGSMGDTGREVGQEFVQNLGEGIGSGQVNVTDAVLGTLGGVLPALGAAGAVVGIGATVVGMIAQGMADTREKVKQAGADVFAALREGMLDQAGQESLVMSALGVDNMPDALRKISTYARRLGVSPAEVFTSIASGKATPGLAAAVAAQGTSEMGWFGGGSMTEGQYAAGQVAGDIASAAAALRVAADALAAQAGINAGDYPGPAPTAGGYDPYTNRRPPR